MFETYIHTYTLEGFKHTYIHARGLQTYIHTHYSPVALIYRSQLMHTQHTCECCSASEASEAQKSRYPAWTKKCVQTLVSAIVLKHSGEPVRNLIFWASGGLSKHWPPSMYVCMSETSKHVCMYVCMLSMYVCMYVRASGGTPPHKSQKIELSFKYWTLFVRNPTSLGR